MSAGFKTVEEYPVTEHLCSVCFERQHLTPGGDCCKNGHGGADPATAEEVKKHKAKLSRAAAKTKEFAEAEIEDASVEYQRARLDLELIHAEVDGAQAKSEDENPKALALAIAVESAAIRRAYAERFTIDDPGKAAWAAQKVAEARTRHEEAQELLKAEVRRTLATWERRKEFFEGKLEAWAKEQPREPRKCPDCKKGLVPDPARPERETLCARCQGRGKIPSTVAARFPSHGVRLDLREKEEGGVTIHDEDKLCEEIVAHLGLMTAVEMGLVRQVERLDLAKVREFLEATLADPKPALKITAASYTEPKTVEKLQIARL